MSVSKVSITQITGLSTSGAVDGSGTWNTGVDLDSFVTVPAGATGVMLLITNTSSSARWAGVRTAGKTNAVMHMDFPPNDAHATRIVPLGTGNTIDCYLEATTVQFYILGFTDDTWTFFDIDGTLPSITNTGGAAATVTAPADVDGATAILAIDYAGQWSPTGEASQISTNASGASPNQLLMKIDGSRQLDLAGTNPVNILGYTTSNGVTWTTWLSSAESITADGVWNNGTSSDAGSHFAHIQWTGFNQAHGFGTREDGVTTPSNSPLNTQGLGRFTPLSDAGAYEYNAESTFTGTPYVVAWLGEHTAGGGSTTTVTPTTGSLTLSGLSALVNDFNTITLRGTLVNEAGSPVANSTDISCLVWYGDLPAGPPDQSLSSLTTNANGSYSFALALGGLSFNDPVYRVIVNDDATRNHAGRRIPDYE